MTDRLDDAALDRLDEAARAELAMRMGDDWITAAAWTELIAPWPILGPKAVRVIAEHAAAASPEVMLALVGEVRRLRRVREAAVDVMADLAAYRDITGRKPLTDEIRLAMYDALDAPEAKLA